jgi:hypothetical protein
MATIKIVPDRMSRVARRAALGGFFVALLGAHLLSTWDTPVGAGGPIMRPVALAVLYAGIAVFLPALAVCIAHLGEGVVNIIRIIAGKGKAPNPIGDAVARQSSPDADRLR